jgi:hypothetical protein
MPKRPAVMLHMLGYSLAAPHVNCGEPCSSYDVYYCYLTVFYCILSDISILCNQKRRKAMPTQPPVMLHMLGYSLAAPQMNCSEPCSSYDVYYCDLTVF